MYRLAWLPLSLFVGCATAAPAPPMATPPAAPSAAPPASASAATVATGPGPAPLPVAAPPGLLLEAKTRPLGDTAKELGKLVGMPVGLLLSALGPDALRTDAGLGAAVLVSERAPDGLLPSLVAAFSVPVTSEQAFSAALGRDRSLWRPKGVGFTMVQGPLEGLFCKTVVALGDAPLRAVCAASEEDVGQVAPYLTRGLPSAELGAGDLRVRVRFSALKPGLSTPLEELKQQQSELLSGGGALLLGGLVDPALLTAPGALMDEGTRLIDAQEGATFGVTLDGNAQAVELSGAWSFRKTDSWLVRLATSRPEQGPTPEVFWRLPQESEVAIFGRGVDGEMQDEPRRVGRKVTGLLLERLGLSDTELKPLDEALGSLPRGDTPWALGSGGQGTWWVLGSEGDGALFPGWLRRSGRALQRLVALGKKSGGQAWKDAAVTLKVEENPAGFPAGSVLIETGATLASELLPGLLPASVGGSGKPSRWVLVATPEGKGRSWLGVAADRAALKVRLRQVTARGAGKDLLGAEPGLDALRGGKRGFGGRVVAGSALEQALARVGKKGGAREKLGAPVVLQGTVEAKQIEGKATIPGALLAELLRATLLGNR